MATNKELKDGLKRMAADFCLLGGGRMMLSRLVARHLNWFDIAERRGMGWRDITRVLAAAGVVGRADKKLSIGTLSSTVWRVRAKSEEKEGNLSPQQHIRIDRKQRNPGQSETRKKLDASSTIGQLTKPAFPNSTKDTGAKTHANRKTGVLAFMSRASAVRQRLED